MKKCFYFFLVLLAALQSRAQIVSQANLLRNEVYGGEALGGPHLNRPLSNGKTVITGFVGGDQIVFNNYDSNNDTVNNFLGSVYVGLVDANDSLEWIKYYNGIYLSALTIDSKDNIYIGGSYKGDLISSTNDTLAVDGYLNYAGNLFLIKLDAAGHTRWMKSTNNNGVPQAEPWVVYLTVDKADHIYEAGLYEEFIEFDEQRQFYRVSSDLGSTPFLAKLDSLGNYVWIRDWKYETGLPAGLAIDSCKIYMHVINGSSQTNTRLRKYDFAGKLLEERSYPYKANNTFASYDISVKKNRMLMLYDTTNGGKIGYFDLNGKKLWDAFIGGFGLYLLTFTSDNSIIFSGGSASDSMILFNTKIYTGITFGSLDTFGNLQWIKNIRYSGSPGSYLSTKGSLYLNAAITSYSNPNNHFTIDTITFKNLKYTERGVVGARFYRLYARYDLNKPAYEDGPGCDFNPVDSCLDREGQVIKGCLLALQNLNLHVVFENAAVNLAWQVADETNVSYYEVQRSTDGKNFSTISPTIKKGNEYKWADEHLPPGVKLLYYRLKVLTNDGKFTFSEIVQIYVNAEPNFSVFPNPAKLYLDLYSKLQFGNNSSVRVYHSRGEKVIAYTLPPSAKMFRINIETLPAGLYYVSVYQNGKVIDKKPIIVIR